ncbi:hypothetical protein BT69DRAFT_1338463 [Atractiella rhizophila]|nr:hypothetical protein BT69DRAFT_1338463 [Atractiella rhizophila]
MNAVVSWLQNPSSSPTTAASPSISTAIPLSPALPNDQPLSPVVASGGRIRQSADAAYGVPPAYYEDHADLGGFGDMREEEEVQQRSVAPLRIDARMSRSLPQPPSAGTIGSNTTPVQTTPTSGYPREMSSLSLSPSTYIPGISPSPNLPASALGLR